MDKKNAGRKIFFLSWGIASMILGVFFSVINNTEQSMGNIAAVSVCLGFLLAFIIIAFRMAALTGKSSRKAKIQREKDRQEGISRYYPLVHAGGLAAPRNCTASVTLSPTELTVSCGGSEYILSITKIRNVDLQFDINETQYLKSSFVKGVVGAAAFGMAGAIIGSVPKTKTRRSVKCYAVISYENAQGEYKTFLLRDEAADVKVCSALVDNLRSRINQQENRVEL